MNDPIIKVLVIDDSAVMRHFLVSALNKQPDLKVLAAAADPYAARTQFLKEPPDVITLDVAMPRMDGLTFLTKLMAAHPTPVVMISSFTQEGSTISQQALRLGAVDFISKPRTITPESLAGIEMELVAKIRAAARGKLKKTAPLSEIPTVPPSIEVGHVVQRADTSPAPGGPMVVLIGASTGGTVALEHVLTHLPADSPPIAIVQHMPENFTGPFAERLNGVSQLQVFEAQDGRDCRPGQAAVAPGGKHMLLEKSPTGYRVRVKDGPPINRHKPSVDVLFRSGANSAGPNAVGIIMTGMGSDGAKALKELHQTGAFTIGQNEETCTVYGMPKAAASLGALDREVALKDIAPLIIELWQKAKRT